MSDWDIFWSTLGWFLFWMLLISSPIEFHWYCKDMNESEYNWAWTMNGTRLNQQSWTVSCDGSRYDSWIVIGLVTAQNMPVLGGVAAGDAKYLSLSPNQRWSFPSISAFKQLSFSHRHFEKIKDVKNEDYKELWPFQRNFKKMYTICNSIFGMLRATKARKRLSNCLKYLSICLSFLVWYHVHP